MEGARSVSTRRFRRRLGRLALLAALVSAAGLAGTAEARSLGTAIGGVFDDEHRFVVTEPRPYVIRVSDLRTGTRRSYSLPCTASSMGRRSPALLSCVSDDDAGTWYSQLLFPRTGALRRIPNTSIGGDSLDTIGRYWMHGIVRCPEAASGLCDLFVDWRTGERRIGGEAYGPRQRDLDTKDLRVMSEVEQVGGWRLRFLSNDGFRLEHDGRTIARLDRFGGEAELTRRAASWSSGSTVFVRPLRAARTFKRSFGVDDRASISQAGGTLVCRVRSGLDPTYPLHVDAISIASIRRRQDWVAVHRRP